MSINSAFLSLKEKELALVPYALHPSWQYVALQNWKDYYMYIYKINNPFSGSKATLLQKTEYPYSYNDSVFAFSPQFQPRFYFDGLRFRSLKKNKILGNIDYKNRKHAIWTRLSNSAKLLAIVRKHLKSKTYVLDIYDAPKGKWIQSYPLAYSIHDIRFSPQSNLLILADAKKQIHFLSLVYE